ncbi:MULTISPECIES: transcriptional regulator [Methylobacterium]|jgi:hypothetical protein|uniref:Transcriptional regulator n=1 Tax=Methylobacterium ajmalii TaxID=2738439 RepID=A0ABV0A2Y2_9HYPH|nr:MULTISPECIES: transcriptional regulator [Methylobacterium]MBZ6411112.1 transcriptional regulator [Methylobacterium sp.]
MRAATPRFVTEEDAVALLRERVAAAGTQRAFAAAAGVNASDLGQVLGGRKAPSRTLLAAVGVRKALVLEDRACG